MNIDLEYEAAFPFEQEYQLWIASVERDFQEECEHLATITAPKNRSTFHYTEDFSPFATVNS
jgi:hypothetical protein